MPTLHWKYFFLSQLLAMISMNDRAGALQHWSIVACMHKSLVCSKAKMRPLMIIHTFISSASAKCCLMPLYFLKMVKEPYRSNFNVFLQDIRRFRGDFEDCAYTVVLPWPGVISELWMPLKSACSLRSRQKPPVCSCTASKKHLKTQRKGKYSFHTLLTVHVSLLTC